jgi:hypothetical protein
MRFGVLLSRERARIGLVAAKDATTRMWRQLGTTDTEPGLPPWLYLSGVLDVPLNVPRYMYGRTRGHLSHAKGTMSTCIRVC